MKTKTILLFFILFTLQCGIFSPRDGVEEPQTGANAKDRLGISEILDGTGRYLVGQAYEDMFVAEFVYTYNRIYTRNKVDHIAYLEELTRQYPDIDTRWVEDTTDGKRDSYFGTDSGTIYREYFIWKTEPVSPDVLNDFTGKARIDLRYIQEKHGWAIVRWYDESEDGFFHHASN